MVKLVTHMREQHRNLGALIDEFDALLAGKAGTGEQLRELYNFWNVLWCAQHGSDYVFTFQKDAPQMKRLLKMLGVDELKHRITNYLKTREPFYFDKKHPFGMFVATINSWAGGNADDELELDAVGCNHTPRCKSDQEHTRRRRDDMLQGAQA